MSNLPHPLPSNTILKKLGLAGVYILFLIFFLQTWVVDAC